jgi:hypothetical protein
MNKKKIKKNYHSDLQNFGTVHKFILLYSAHAKIFMLIQGQLYIHIIIACHISYRVF